MKRLVLIVVIIVFTLETYAQRRSVGPQFLLGAMDGVTTSQDSGDGYVGYKQYGFTMGIYGRKFLGRSGQKYSVELEAVYKEKGANYNQPPVSNPNANTNPFYVSPTFGYYLKLNYIEFPLLFQYNLVNGNLRGLTLEGGPGFGFLVHQSEIIATPGYNTVQPPTFNSTELSYNIGARYIFESNFGWDLRFSRSITPIRDNASGGNNYNSVISLALTYQFGF